MGSSLNLMLEAERYTPGGVHSNTRRVSPQLMPHSGRGGRIHTMEGTEYIDYHAAFGPIILGHCNEAVTNAVIKALESQDLYGIGATELEVRACQKIVEHVPSAEKVLFTNSGSEATFHAIRVARAFTGRKKIIKFQGCYHGWHDYVARNMLSKRDMIGKRDPGSAGMLDEVIDSTLVCRFNDIDDVESVIRSNQGQVAAIILEPIPHNVGCILPDISFLKGLRELATQNGIVLIFDEIITGFRHSLGGYQSICGVIPDLTTLGKAIANGYPIAAVCGRQEIMDYFSTNPTGNVLFAGTYNGHTVGTAAILATVEVLEKEPVYSHVGALADKLRTGLQNVADRFGLNVLVRGFGSVFVPYFMSQTFRREIKTYEDLMETDEELDLMFRREMIKRGILMFPMPWKRNHVMYAHTMEDVNITLEAAESVMKLIGRGAIR